MTTERSLDRPAGGYGFSVIVALLVGASLPAGGYLIVGAAAAAAMQVLVPRRVIGQLASPTATSFFEPSSRSPRRD